MSWSLSALKTYEQCGLKYKLKYIEKKEDKASVWATRGTDNHAVVESYLKGTTNVLPDSLSLYQSFFDGIRQYENYPELKISLDREWKPTDWKDGWFRGVLDLLVIRTPAEAFLYDWKTGKIYPDHDDQKAIYSLGVFSQYPAVRTVRAIHVYIDLGKNREQMFHKDEVHELRRKWENRVQRLEQNPSLIPNPGWHCRYCNFSREKGGPCQF